MSQCSNCGNPFPEHSASDGLCDVCRHQEALFPGLMAPRLAVILQEVVECLDDAGESGYGEDFADIAAAREALKAYQAVVAKNIPTNVLRQDVKELLFRAVACIEDRSSLTEKETAELCEDLTVMARCFEAPEQEPTNVTTDERQSGGLGNG